ncbi:uncharacterized protein BX664DRAFT_323313 [Halteromyces radiatus]|uniref:uncharacterized protein n=1 Tax=Halteromyces radiatus TaxID=101107 RepID=UPI0022208D55|nr:uncharacterized protein BX664DRAFT_323313 [Halteromyces radiatus]KAI8096183.1 hypothetical protein BX664DRAFT_323313 [Halteromyces radiatus]
MLPKLFLLAATALLSVNAQSSSASAAAPSGGAFTFKETYPSGGSKPAPKPEWMDLIKNANITNAPVVKGGANGPTQSGSADPYCDWTFTGCTRPDDIVACPKGQWGITYDDGPTQYSSKLYDFLDTTQQKATLFMIGGQVVAFPDLVTRAYKTGHEIAMHTWSHSYLTTETNEQIVAELMWTATAIKEVTGVTPRFYRPPYGDIDDRVRSIGHALGFIPVIWNHDTDDWKVAEDKSFDEHWIDGNVTEWAKEASSATTGGISLEHDLYQKTVDAAIRVLPTLQKAYKVTTVGQCVNQPSYKEGGAQNSTTSASSSVAPSASSSAVSPAKSSGSSDAVSPAGASSSSSAQQSTSGSSRAAVSSAVLVLGASIAFMLA